MGEVATAPHWTEGFVPLALIQLAGHDLRWWPGEPGNGDGWSWLQGDTFGWWRP